MKIVALLCLLSYGVNPSSVRASEAPDAGTFGLVELPGRVVLSGKLPAGVSYFDAGYADYRPLLSYIDEHDVDPCDPVEGDPHAKPCTLAFPLGEKDIRRTLPETERVVRTTLPAVKVARYAFRGGYDKATLDKAEGKLRAWIAREHPELREAGTVTYAYRSPYYYPAFVKKAEVRIPVLPRVSTGSPAPSHDAPQSR